MWGIEHLGMANLLISVTAKPLYLSDSSKKNEKKNKPNDVTDTLWKSWKLYEPCKL